jgi:AraC-like DNA-binding protein
MKSKLCQSKDAAFQEHTLLPDTLNADQRRQVDLILRQSHILLISCLFWRMNIREVIPHRTLSDSLLYVPVKGSIRCRIGGVCSTVRPGQFMLVAEGVEHEALHEEECGVFEAFAIHTHAHTNQAKPLFSVFSSAIGVIQTPEFWFDQFRLLTHLMGTDQKLGRQFGEPLLLSLLVQQVISGNPLEDIPAAGDPRPWRAVYSILSSFPRCPSVRALARDSGVSEVQFRKLFRAQTGESPKSYMLRIRLDKARVLLQSDPSLTVKEVSERTGFTDPHIMHAAFKRAYGITPAACRRADLDHRKATAWP